MISRDDCTTIPVSNWHTCSDSTNSSTSYTCTCNSSDNNVTYTMDCYISYAAEWIESYYKKILVINNKKSLVEMGRSMNPGRPIRSKRVMFKNHKINSAR